MAINYDAAFRLNAQVNGAQELDGFADKLDEIKKKGKDVPSALNGVDSSLRGIKGAVQLAVVADVLQGIGRAAYNTAAALTDAQVKLDKFRITAKFAIGGNADDEYRYVIQQARSLGLELDSTASGYIKLAAAARGTTLEGQQTRNVFEAVAKASATMGLSGEEANGALLAISQMMSKGKVSAEELRGQLGERLPGAFQIAARAMGVTTSELDAMLASGELLATDFLPKFADQLKSELGGSANEAADTMQGALNRVSTSWLLLKQTIVDAGLGDFIKGQLAIADDAMTGFQQRIALAKLKGESVALAAGGQLLAQANPVNLFSYQAQALENQLKQLQQARDDMERKSVAWNKQVELDKLDTQIRQLRSDIALLQGQNKQGGQKSADQYDREREAAQQRAAIEKAKQLNTDYIKANKDNNEKLAEELAKQKTIFEQGVISVEEYEKRKAALREKYKDKESDSKLKQRLQQEQDAIRNFKQQAEVGREATDYEKAQWEIQNGRYKDFSASAKREILLYAQISDAKKQEAEATKEGTQAVQEEGRVRDQHLKKVDDYVLQLQEQVATMGMTRGELEKYKIEQLLTNDAIYGGADAVERYRQKIEQLQKKKQDKEDGGFFKGFRQGLDDYKDHAGNVMEQVRQATNNAFKGMEDALVQFVMTGKMNFKSMANSIISDLVRIAIQQSITVPLANAIFGGTSGAAGGSFMSWLGGKLTGARASGGPVAGGGTYLVGENGPEIFTPKTSGAIIPNDKLGVGGGSVNNSVTVVVNAGGAVQAQGNNGNVTEFARGIGALVDQKLMEAMLPGGLFAKMGR